MSNISVTNINDGDAVTAASVNNQVNTIVNDYNGNIDNSNIKSGANISTAKLAGDGGVNYTMLSTGVPVQVVSTNFSAVATGTTLIPEDDTIPQITEGTEFMTQAITPKASTNTLVITVTAQLSQSAASNTIIGALFQDATSNALAAGENLASTAGSTMRMTLTHTMLAGTVSSTTFRFRAGPVNAATVTFNGFGGNRKFGGITLSNITITEIKV